VRRLSQEGLLVLGVWLALFVTNPGRNETVDVEMRQVLARHIWTTGHVTLTSLPQSDMPLAWVPAGPGRWAAPYGIGQSLVFIPFDAAGALLEHLSPPSWRERVGWLPIGLGLLPLLGVGCWLAIRKVLQAQGFDRQWALVGSLGLLFGTIAFHYAGQAQEEMLIAFFLTLSLLFALRLRAAPTVRNALLSGIFAGACLITRPVSVFSLSILPFIFWSAAKDGPARARLFLPAGAVVVASLLVMLGYNFARFGSPFAIGYDRLGHVSKIAFDARSPKVLATLVLGPGIGLLVLSPLLLLCFWGLAQLWRKDRAYFLGLIASVLSCYLFFSCWHDSYSGGVAWGTRYQCHLLPLYAVPLILGIQQLVQTLNGRRLVVVVATVSLAIQLASVVVTHHMEYVESACQNGSEEALASDLAKGQLARRMRNIIRWVTKAGPPQCDSREEQRMVDLCWDRYVPNFWGPVIAHRLSRRAGLLLLFMWSGLTLAAVVLLGRGTRDALQGVSRSSKDVAAV
jgi:hypothetical protein